MDAQLEAQVRCACDDCGAHTIGQVGPNGVAGWCPNCGSYQVTPVRITGLKSSLPLRRPSPDHVQPPPFGERTPRIAFRVRWPNPDMGR